MLQLREQFSPLLKHLIAVFAECLRALALVLLRLHSHRVANVRYWPVPDAMISSNSMAVFRFRLLPWFLLWVAAMLVLSTGMALLVASRGGALAASVVLALGYAFTAFVAYLLLTGSSDIVLEERGISRRILGWTWQTIRWDNVKLIRAFPVALGSTFKRGINVYPVAPSGLRLTPGGKLSFVEAAEHLPRLRQALNLYIAQHRIAVEVTEAGATVSASAL